MSMDEAAQSGENWIMFWRELGDGERRLVSVDVSLAPNGEARSDQARRAWPCVLLVEVRIGSGETGMGESEDVEAVDAAVDPLWGWLAPRRGLLVGRVRGGPRLIYVAYVSAGVAAMAVDRVTSALAGFRARVESRPDAGWARYGELLPSDREQQAADDMKVFAALASSGDIADRARPVEHWAFMPNERAVRTFLEGAWKLGLKEVERGATDDGFIMVKLSHMCAATSEALTPITSALHELAESVGGDYDGWETQVVKD